MSGPGRPSTDEVERRRTRILLFLVASAAESADAIARLTKLMGLKTDTTIKNDLVALKRELETVGEDELPEPLLQAIGGADTYRALHELTQRIMVAVGDGTLEGKLGEFLLQGITVQGHMIRAEKEERPLEAVRALELLTPQELEVLAEHRRRLAGPPIAPGAAVPPPGPPPTGTGADANPTEGSKP